MVFSKRFKDAEATTIWAPLVGYIYNRDLGQSISGLAPFADHDWGLI